MPEVVDWPRCQPHDVVQRAADVLESERFVVFPTETGYVVAANSVSSRALAHLQRAAEGKIALTAAGPGDLLRRAPNIGRMGYRLARNCWPGPLDIAWGSDLPFCCPAHDAVQQILTLFPSPLAFAEIGPAASAEQLRPWEDALGLVIDDGPAYLAGKSTIVRVQADRWQIVREGVISAAALDNLSRCRILFVCTGNTCRSPLAQGLCAMLLAERLGCAPADLVARGFIVQSAGLAAMIGGEAAQEATAIARELGADLSGHRTQPLTLELLRQADFLFVMTQSHLQTLGAIQEHEGPVPRLLAADGEDIPDPIGSSTEVYRECAAVIVRHLQRLLPELCPIPLPAAEVMGGVGLAEAEEKV